MIQWNGLHQLWVYFFVWIVRGCIENWAVTLVEWKVFDWIIGKWMRSPQWQTRAIRHPTQSIWHVCNLLSSSIHSQGVRPSLDNGGFLCFGSCWQFSVGAEGAIIREQWVRSKYERKEWVAGSGVSLSTQIRAMDYTVPLMEEWIVKRGAKVVRRFFVLPFKIHLTQPHTSNCSATFVEASMACSSRYFLRVLFEKSRCRAKGAIFFATGAGDHRCQGGEASFCLCGVFSLRLFPTLKENVSLSALWEE